MSKENYYQTKKYEWGSSDTAAVAGAIGAIGSAYFNSQNTPGYQPPAPTYNVYQLPGNNNSSGAPAGTTNNTATKTEAAKVLGMPTEVVIIGVIIILAIAGFAFYYFKNKKIIT